LERDFEGIPTPARPRNWIVIADSAYHEKLASILADSEATKLPHETIIAKLDEAGKTFHVLLLSTKMTIPSTSVFLRLE
jgi:hypothetical protein